jgi:hypothetical protein
MVAEPGPSRPLSEVGNGSIGLGIRFKREGQAVENLYNVAQEGGEAMATIRASCEQCGDVELTTDDVQVRVCTLDNQGTYSFRCPDCAMTVVKPAETRTVDLLVASGVAYSTWSPPLELTEPRGSGPAITHDDLLDFHHQLEDDTALHEALMALRS